MYLRLCVHPLYPLILKPKIGWIIGFFILAANSLHVFPGTHLKQFQAKRLVFFLRQPLQGDMKPVSPFLLPEIQHWTAPFCSPSGCLVIDS